nr:hypothetical protein BaRGS_029086 [Batillaria attramentaria]
MLVDESQQEVVEPGQTGEVLCRGPHVFTGYLGMDQAAHDNVFTHNGWFRTTDVGFRNGKGELHVIGRKYYLFFDSLASRYAAILRREGIRQGDVVCNTLPNSPERLLTDLGIMLAGAVAMNGMVVLSDGADFVGSTQRGGCVAVIVDPKQKLNQPLTVLESRLHSRVGHTVDCPDAPLLKTLLFVDSGVLNMDNKEDYEDGNSGLPLPGLVDESQQGVVEPGQTGEVLCRGPHVFSGYLGMDQAAHDNVFTHDGWFRTTDAGFRNGKGSCMSSAEMPVPDSIKYQELCACVMPQPGIGVTEEEVREFCNTLYLDPETVESAVPRYYLFFDRFPTTVTGKTDRKAVLTSALRTLGMTDACAAN